ncbi:MAG: sugar phosphate isomerase/epimerase [Chloroflexota bacterium]
MIPPIALQLYTLREALSQDFTGIIEKIAEIGYIGVETAFFPEDIDLIEATQIIRDAGLSIPAAHCEIPLDDQEDAVLTQAKTLGCEKLIWHGWPQDPDYGSIDGIKRLATRYNKANEVCRANGYQFGIHNHWWEFEPVAGQYPYQILTEEMHSDIFFEVDTYWVKTAGPNPVDVVQELGSRAPLLHIKDGPAVKEKPMVAAGQGSMNFDAILAAAGDNPEWLIVEMDECATDMMTAVAESYQYLTSNGYATGNR